MTKKLAEMITPTELAEELGTDVKTCRRFLRTLTAQRPGKGGRWLISRDDLEAIYDEFQHWGSTRATVFTFDPDED